MYTILLENTHTHKYSDTHFIYWNLIFYYKSIWKLARAYTNTHIHEKKTRASFRTDNGKWIYTAHSVNRVFEIWLVGESFKGRVFQCWKGILDSIKLNKMLGENVVIHQSEKFSLSNHFQSSEHRHSNYADSSPANAFRIVSFLHVRKSNIHIEWHSPSAIQME